MAYGNRAKYCDACKAKQARKQEAEYRERTRKKKSKPYSHVCDSPEQIQICLNCTKKCKHGTCKEVREAGRTKPHPSAQQLEERRKQALELRRHGLSYKKIAEELGCTENAITHDFVVMRQAGVEI